MVLDDVEEGAVLDVVGGRRGTLGDFPLLSTLLLALAGLGDGEWLLDFLPWGRGENTFTKVYECHCMRYYLASA